LVENLYPPRNNPTSIPFIRNKIKAYKEQSD
jgi:hypothetical protein